MSFGAAACFAPASEAATTVNCTVSAGGIAFGIYNPLGTVSDASTGTLRVTCNGSFAGTAGPFTVPAGGSNFATGTMYGLIPASQDVAPGSYADVITVTVTY